MGRINSFRICNVQSWDKESPLIELSYERINVLIGRSETGKSVPFKLDEVMCFFNYYGRKTRKSIIRRGCDCGQYAIKVENGNIILLTIYKTKQAYYLLKTDGTKMSWIQDYPPQEILNELGWHIQLDSKIILNVMHKDMPVPFVFTSPKWNADALKFITEEPELESAMNVMEEALSRIATKKLTVLAEYNQLRRQSLSMSYLDEGHLRKLLNRKKSALRAFECFSEIGENLQSIEKLDTTRPAIVEVRNIDQLIKISEYMKILKSDAIEYLDVSESEPDKKVSINENQLRDLKAILESIEDFGACLNELGALDVMLPAPVAIDINLSKIINLSEKAHLLGNIVYAIYKLESDVVLNSNALSTAIKDIAILERTLKVCPTCGKPFDTEHGECNCSA